MSETVLSQSGLAPATPDVLPVVCFDYSSLPADIAAEAREIAERVRSRMKASIVATGRDLCTMRARLAHGQFGAWVEAELGITPRTAQNYMTAYTQFGNQSEIISHLPASTVYKLAAPSTPESVRRIVAERIQAGDRPEPVAVEKLIRDSKAADREEKSKARRQAFLSKLTPEQRKEVNSLEKRRRRSREQREREAAELDAKLRSDRQTRQRAYDEAIDLIGRGLDVEQLSTLADLMEHAGEHHFSRSIRERLVDGRSAQ